MALPIPRRDGPRRRPRWLVRRHPAGWTAIVAVTPAWVPPTVTLPAVIDRLLRHSDRSGPLILEHLGPAAATVLLARCVGPGQHTGPIGEGTPQ